MGIYIAPEVYIREFDFSNFVQPSSSCVAGLVITSQTGPLLERTFVSNAKQAMETFGLPSLSSKGMYGLLQFLRRGNQAWVVRVAGSAKEQPTVDVPGADSKGEVTNSNASPYIIAASTYASHTGTQLEDFIIASASNNNKLTITVTLNGVAGSSQVVTIPDDTYTATTFASTLNGLTTGVNFVAVGGAVKIVHSGGTGSTNSFVLNTVANSCYTDLGFTAATYAGSNGTDNIQVTTVNDTNGTDAHSITLTAGTRTAAQIAAEIDAALGTDGSAVAITTESGDFIRISNADGGSAYSVQVLSASTADTVLGFDNSVHSGNDSGDTTLTFTERYFGDTTVSVVIANGSNWTVSNLVYKVQVFQNGILMNTYDDVRKTAANAAEELQLFAAVIGTSANPIDPHVVVADGPGTGEVLLVDAVAGDTFDLVAIGADPSGYSVTEANVVAGLALLSDKELVEIDLLLAPGQAGDDVVTELITIGETRKDCLALIDPPQGLTPAQVVQWHNGTGAYTGHSSLNSSYAAMAYPWVKIDDAVNDEEVWTAPSGHFAAIIAYSDSQSAPWYPAAGLNRGKIIAAIDLERSLTIGERELLLGTTNRVNTFVDFTVDGPTLFSQVTLHRQSTKLAKIHVRRMLLVAQRAIGRAVRSLNFEPNDQRTWQRFELLVNPFLQGIANDRGLADFKVVANEITTPDSLRDRDEMRGIIYLKPSSVAEKILVDFVLTSQGASFASLDSLLF